MNPPPLGAALVFVMVAASTASAGTLFSVPSGLSLGTLKPQASGTLATKARITPILQAGHPRPDPTSGILPDSPDLRIDPNTTTSPFAGVGSIFADDDPSDDLGVICTATAISPTTILTAGHCVDITNGDGKSDVLPENLLFVLNDGSDFSQIIQADGIWVNPNYNGSASAVGSINDDLAVIHLSQPLPPGTPIYPLANPDWLSVAPVILAGYGASGDGVDGYYVDPEFQVKRVGANLIEYAELDDEGGPDVEIVNWDFEYEGDPERYDVFGIPFAFPNQIETTLGGGDSGGPAFMLNPNDPNDMTLYLAAVNTYSFWFPDVPDHDQPGKFGSGSGGVWLNQSYQDWIHSIPETSPALAVGLLVGMVVVASRWRRTSA